MLGTSFAQYERAFREQLGEMFAPAARSAPSYCRHHIQSRGTRVRESAAWFFFGVSETSPRPRDVLREQTHGRYRVDETDLAGAMDTKPSARRIAR